MPKLIPLASIAYRARSPERAARKRFGSRAAALRWAVYRIDVAPGCHGRPYYDPPVVGWVCTREAAEALCAEMIHMPGGTSHRAMACNQLGD